MTQAEPDPRWKAAGPGRWKTALGPDYPEIVLLYLSNDDYKKFSANPKTYVDDLHILAKKINKVVAGEIVPGKGAAPWCVHIIHTPNSTVTYVAWQEP